MSWQSATAAHASTRDVRPQAEALIGVSACRSWVGDTHIDEVEGVALHQSYEHSAVPHNGQAHRGFASSSTFAFSTPFLLWAGFARWAEHLATDHVCPHFRIWDPFLTDVVERAMSLDSLENSHPIEIEVRDPDEINEIFDQISYGKGLSRRKSMVSSRPFAMTCK